MRLSSKKLTYESPEMEITMFEHADIVTNSNVDEDGGLPVNGDYWNGRGNADYIHYK